MKKHTTVKITEKQLRNYYPCESGLATFRKFAGKSKCVTLSTDPEHPRNIALATELGFNCNGSHVWWLARQISNHEHVAEMARNSDGAGWAAEDSMQIAQQLAHLADHIATKAGR